MKNLVVKMVAVLLVMCMLIPFFASCDIGTTDNSENTTTTMDTQNENADGSFVGNTDDTDVKVPDSGDKTEESDNSHTHVFNKQDADSKYLKTPATHHSKAIYFYSCECGEKSAVTFSVGEVIPHVFDRRVAGSIYLNTPATHDTAATYFYSCECGEKGTEFFDSNEYAHVFDKQIIEDNYLKSVATHTKKAEYFYACECGHKGYTTFEYGETIPHNFNRTIVAPEYLNTVATASDVATYFHSCMCGAKGETSFYEPYPDFTFRKNEDGYSIIAYNGSSPNIILPSMYNEEPVTELCDRTFSYCNTLKVVEIPGSIISVGKAAFYGCENLERVEMQFGVKSIGADAFRGCTKLIAVDMPNSVATIGVAAFAECSKLADVDIPTGVTSIERLTFYYCESLRYIEIPEGVTEIKDLTFQWCNSLVYVKLPNSIISIGDGAFFDCKSLVYINIPASVQNIGNNVFAQCYNLTEICNDSPFNITKNNGTSSGENSIDIFNMYTSTSENSNLHITDDGYVFYLNVNEVFLMGYIGNETELVLPSTYNGKSYKLSPCAFVYDTKITSVVISSGVTDFLRGSGYSGVRMPFNGCINLTSITVDSGNLRYRSINNCVVDITTKEIIIGCKSSVIPTDGSVTRIGYGAFAQCTNLTSISIPDVIVMIGSCAFESCDNLIEWENDIGYVDKWVVSSYKDPAEVTLRSNIVGIAAQSLSCMRNAVSITIPDGVKYIGMYAFSDCTELKSITIPSSIISIDRYAFGNCEKLVSVYITDISSWCNIDFKDYEYTNPLWYACDLYVNNSLLTDLKIPSNIIHVKDSTFANCTSIKTVTISSSVESIGTNAFKNCSHITSVTIPSTVSNIGADAFKNCTGISSLYISDVAEWCDIDFENQYSNPLVYATYLYVNGGQWITVLNIPSSVTRITSHAFVNSESLRTIYIPTSLDIIDSNAFFNSGITEVFYYGTSSQWTNINIYSGNDAIVNAKRTCYGDVYDESESTSSITEVGFTAYMYSNTFVNDFTSEESSSAYQLYTRLDDYTLLQYQIGLWRGISAATNYEKGIISKKDLYKAIIYDLMMGEANAQVEIENLMSQSTTKLMLEYSDFLLDVADISQELLKTEKPTPGEIKIFSDKYFEGIPEIEIALKHAENWNDALYTAAMYQTFSEMNGHFSMILQEISNNTELPKELRDAASDCISYYESAGKSFKDRILLHEFGKMTIHEFGIQMASAFADAVLTAFLPGYEVGKLVINITQFLADKHFDLSEFNTAYYTLEASVGMQSALRNIIKSSKHVDVNYLDKANEAHAEFYMYAIDMYQTSILLGCDYSIALLDKNITLASSASDRQDCEELQETIRNGKIQQENNYNQFANMVSQCYNEYYA